MNSPPGPTFSVSVSNLVQIGSKMAELWPFNWFHNVGCRYLGFLTYVNFDGKSGCGTQFSASASNSVQIYAIMAALWPKEWFSIWRPPPSWILWDINLASKTSCRTSFSVPVSNLVRIRSKMAALLSFNRFKNGGRRHLEFTSGDYFLSFGPLWVVAGDISVKFHNCSEMAADLLSFVKKYKMAAAAIMNCYLVTLDNQRSLLHGRKSLLKFHVNRITTFRAMVIW